MQQFLLSTVSLSLKDKIPTSINFPLDRSLVYIPEEKVIYIKKDNKIYPIGRSTPDKDCINKNDNLELYLSDNIHNINTIIQPDNNCKAITKIIGTTTDSRKTIPLINGNSYDNSISGSIIRYGTNISETYEFTLNSNGNGIILGSSFTSIKAKLVKLTISNNIYYGLKFSDYGNASIHFRGYDNRKVNITNDILNYSDEDISVEDI